MSFHSGRVSFARFRVMGDLPKVADTVTLDRLGENAFRESDFGKPDEVESGWVTGEHLFDTDFTWEKNVYGDPAGSLLLFALRIDTNKVPADVKKAYKQLNEKVVATGNPSGFASKTQKKEAAELTDRQLHEDLAAGKYRKSKMVPVLWDLRSGTILAGGTSNVISEQLHATFRRTFMVDLEPIGSGAMAGEYMQKKGLQREFEDLRPSPFTAAPAAAIVDHEEAGLERQDVSIPPVPWAFKSTNTRDFLGNEWFIWMWWIIENHEGIVTIEANDGTDRKLDVAVVIDKSLDMDCAWGIRGKQSLRGDGPARLPEAGEGIAGGKWPRKSGMIIADTEEGLQWELTLQLDRMQVSSALLPQAPEAESQREVTEYRLDHTQRLNGILDGLFAAFLAERTSSTWSTKRQAIRKWINARRRKIHAEQAHDAAVDFAAQHASAVPAVEENASSIVAKIGR